MFPTFITLKALAILMLLDEAMIPKERFFLLPPELINYLLANMRRSFAYARKLVADLPLLEKVQPELPVEPQLATDWYDVEYPVGQVAALQVP